MDSNAGKQSGLRAPEVEADANAEPGTRLGCPTCGKVLSKRRARQIELNSGFAMVGNEEVLTPQKEVLYRDQAIKSCIQEIGFWWAGKHLSDATAIRLIRGLVPNPNAADLAGFYAMGVAWRRKQGYYPASELGIIELGDLGHLGDLSDGR